MIFRDRPPPRRRRRTAGYGSFGDPQPSSGGGVTALVGGGVGLAAGGPIGGAIGAVIGLLLGKMVKSTPAPQTALQTTPTAGGKTLLQEAASIANDAISIAKEYGPKAAAIFGIGSGAAATTTAATAAALDASAAFAPELGATFAPDLAVELGFETAATSASDAAGGAAAATAGVSAAAVAIPLVAVGGILLMNQLIPSMGSAVCDESNMYNVSTGGGAWPYCAIPGGKPWADSKGWSLAQAAAWARAANGPGGGGGATRGPAPRTYLNGYQIVRYGRR